MTFFQVSGGSCCSRRRPDTSSAPEALHGRFCSGRTGQPKILSLVGDLSGGKSSRERRGRAEPYIQAAGTNHRLQLLPQPPQTGLA
jgi:hypothetical protein